MSKRETIIDLGNTVKIYKMYNLSDDVNKTGIEFNKRGEPVGGEFICELKDAKGEWKYEQYYEELKLNWDYFRSPSMLIETMRTLTIELENVTHESFARIMKAFRFESIHDKEGSFLCVLENKSYCIVYLPIITDETTLCFTPHQTIAYSLMIRGTQDKEKTEEQLGFFFIPQLKKEKCKYCGMDNTRKLDEKYHKDLKADYCCEECGEYFSTDKEENKFNKISKSNFREAVNSIPEIKTYKEAMSILLMTSLWLENSEIKEIERTIKKQWKRIYNKRLHESLNYIAKNYYCDINTKRVEKAWLQYIKFIMSITHSIDITDVKLDIE